MQPPADEASTDEQLPPGTSRADFFTGGYGISADVTTGDRRLLEVLRDNTRQYIELRRLRIRSTAATETSPAACSDGLLNKLDIHWVALRAEPSRAEARLYGYIKKTPVRVRLVLPSHCIEGNVFVESSAIDPATVFLRGIEKSTERFIAVGSASITSASGDLDSANLAIVNRSAVSLFSVVR